MGDTRAKLTGGPLCSLANSFKRKKEGLGLTLPLPASAALLGAGFGGLSPEICPSPELGLADWAKGSPPPAPVSSSFKSR